MIYNKYTELDNINRLYAACRGLYRVKLAEDINSTEDIEAATVAKVKGIHKQLTDIYKAVDSGTTVLNEAVTRKVNSLKKQLESYKPFLNFTGYSGLVDTGNRLVEEIDKTFGLKDTSGANPIPQPTPQPTPTPKPTPKPAPAPTPTPEEIAAAREAANPVTADTSYGAGLDPRYFGPSDTGSSYGNIDPRLVSGNMNTGYYSTDKPDDYMASAATGYGSTIDRALTDKLTTGAINTDDLGAVNPDVSIAYTPTGKPVRVKTPKEPKPGSPDPKLSGKPKNPKVEAAEELRKASPEVKAEAAKAMESGVSLEQLVQLLKMLNKSDSENGLNFGSSKIDLHFGGMPMTMGGMPMVMMGGMPMMMGGGGSGGGGGMDPGSMMMQLIMMGKSPDEASKIVKNYMSTFGSMLGGGADEEEEEAAEAPIEEVVPGTLYRIGNIYYGPDGSELDRASAVRAIAAHKARMAASAGSTGGTGDSGDSGSTVVAAPSGAPGSTVITTSPTGMVDIDSSDSTSSPAPTPPPTGPYYKKSPYEGITTYNRAKRKFIADLTKSELNKFDKRWSGTGLGYGAIGGLAGGSLGYLGGDALAKAVGFDNNSFGHNILRYGLGATGLALGGIGAYRFGRGQRRKQLEDAANITGGNTFDSAYLNGRIKLDGSSVDPDFIGLPRKTESEDGFPGTSTGPTP